MSIKKNIKQTIGEMQAYLDVQNIAGRLVFALNFHQAEKILSFFALDQEDVSVEYADEGVFTGPDKVRRFISERLLPYKVGELTDMQLTTPIVEVADDLKTAKAMWLTPGIGALVREDRDPLAVWIWGALACDFLFEDGVWKVWHLHWYKLFKADNDYGWAADTSMINRKTPLSGFADPTTYHNPFTPDYIRKSIPGTPAPYETWQDTGWMLKENDTYLKAQDIDVDGIDDLTEEEFAAAEKAVARLLPIQIINNNRGRTAIFHDDQHIGQKRRVGAGMKRFPPTLNGEKISSPADPMQAVVDSLEGNMLLHAITTQIFEVSEDADKLRTGQLNFGVQGLDLYREGPITIWRMGNGVHTYVLEDGEWIMFNGGGGRVTKNEYHAGWVRSLVPTNRRPPISDEDDRAFLGRYGYYKDEVRMPVPEPPHPDTWEKYPVAADESWINMNIKEKG